MDATGGGGGDERGGKPHEGHPSIIQAKLTCDVHVNYSPELLNISGLSVVLVCVSLAIPHVRTTRKNVWELIDVSLRSD